MQIFRATGLKATITLWLLASVSADACAAVVGVKEHVVNADQSVIIIWDKESRTQHFIRKADFKTDAEDVGFVVPSPSRPQLDESGDKAFTILEEITAPVRYVSTGFSCGCSPAGYVPRNSSVRVIEQKRVAGFDATVLTARSGKDLVEWLADNGYAYSPAMEEWAKPYLNGDWHFTALKVTKDPHARAQQELKAASLRISFKTDRPLFPYREPESGAASKALGAKQRLLRIFFISDTQYEGRINGKSWGAKTVWSGDITPWRKQLLEKLGLPDSTGPQRWWLTNIEDLWPYEQAEGDVYFTPVDNPRSFNLDSRNRPVQMDASLLILLMLGGLLKVRRLSGTKRH